MCLTNQDVDVLLLYVCALLTKTLMYYCREKNGEEIEAMQKVFSYEVNTSLILVISLTPNPNRGGVGEVFSYEVNTSLIVVILHLQLNQR